MLQQNDNNVKLLPIFQSFQSQKTDLGHPIANSKQFKDQQDLSGIGRELEVFLDLPTEESPNLRDSTQTTTTININSNECKSILEVVTETRGVPNGTKNDIETS